MKICFFNQKGGVGKTSLCILVGSALAAAGRRVAYEDHDPQQTLSWWCKHIGHAPMIGDTGALPDVVIADTPGSLGAGLRAGLANADRLVLVSELAIPSYHASARALIEVPAIVRPKVSVVFNRVRTQTLSGRQDQGAVACQLGVRAIEPAVPLRSGYEQVMALGWGAASPSEREIIFKVAIDIMKV